MPVDESQAKEYRNLYLRNQEHLMYSQPQRTEEFYTVDGQWRLLKDQRQAFAAGSAYTFGIFCDRDLVGRVALSGVERGPFQNAHIGFFVDKSAQHRGIATQAVRLAVDFGFNEARLHRIDAAVMPGNLSSMRVLEKNGFQVIGLSPRHLQIAGGWRDHVLLAVTREIYADRAEPPQQVVIG
ncbi:MAG: GNAT family protein [Firmicutes bacterium]|nr:GNAT family protein [Bacillota bacterium]